MANLVKCDADGCGTFGIPSASPGFLVVRPIGPSYEGLYIAEADYSAKHVCGPQCLLILAGNMIAEDARKATEMEAQTKDVTINSNQSDEDSFKGKKKRQ